MNISKNLLWVSIALIAIAGIAFAAFDTNSPWHDLANIATDSTGTVSIDSSPQNNIIDRANVAETGPLCTPTAPCGRAPNVPSHNRDLQPGKSGPSPQPGRKPGRLRYLHLLQGRGL